MIYDRSRQEFINSALKLFFANTYAQTSVHRYSRLMSVLRNPEIHDTNVPDDFGYLD